MVTYDKKSLTNRELGASIESKTVEVRATQRIFERRHVLGN